jgi:hypothetical protein
LNETWDILADFFEEPNRKLAAMLNDERYLWRDTTFKFKPKKRLPRKRRPHVGRPDQLRVYYEKKKRSKLNPDSVIDRFIMTSKSFEEWVGKIQQYQQERVKTHDLPKKRPKRTFDHEKRKYEKQTARDGAHPQNITVKSVSNSTLKTVTNITNFNQRRRGVAIRKNSHSYPFHYRKHPQSPKNRFLTKRRNERRVHTQNNK